jgi:hypothetical protein
MTAEFQVQRSGLAGIHWTTVCRGPEARARAVFHRQLRLSTVGRFRLLAPDGRVLEEREASRLFFSDN